MSSRGTSNVILRLDHYNEISKKNGDYLTEELSKIKGLIPPITPPDRTHIYHKYRIRLDAKALGIDIKPKDFRDKVMKALIAEGMDAGSKDFCRKA